MKIFSYLFLIIVLIASFFYTSHIYAALSCSITASGSCSGTVLLRMSGSTNAHAELPTQSTVVYDNNVVCCDGVTGLSNSCAESNRETIVKLSDVTNAHVEENTENNYGQTACLASTSAGDEITIAYQSTNCTGYDTTLFSMATTTTNSQVGNTTAYTNKVCAKVLSQSITFNISDSSAGFGNLSSAGLRYATGDETGSATEVESYYLDASTNAPSGYTIMVKGDTLSKGATTIDAIGGINTIPTPGANAFGIRAVATGGLGAVSIPYDGSGFAYDAISNFDTIASASSGDGNNTSYSIRRSEERRVGKGCRSRWSQYH